MKENGRETQNPEIIREWRTKEINPQEIAEALGGVLKKDTDNDSRWKIDLNYDDQNPLLTLTCDPKDRRMFLQVNAPSEGADKARMDVNLSNIDDLYFVEYRSAVSGRIQTDMVINVRDSGSDLITCGMILSSQAHASVF